MINENVNIIYLTLGLKCNLNCRYCYQHKDKNKKLYTNNINITTDNVIAYIKRLAILRPFSYKNPITLCFWGGEPFLYFDTIKDIVKKLSGIPIKFSTVTNGTLLTKEIVEWCNSNNFEVTISHDGINTIKTRGINILDNPDLLSLIKLLDNCGFESTFSAYNYDYLQTYYYLRTKMDRDVSIHFNWLNCDKTTSPDLYNFDYLKYNDALDRFFEKIYILCSLKHFDNTLFQSLLPIIPRIKNPQKQHHPSCRQMRNSINIDLNGNITACHPYGLVGTTNTPYNQLLKIYDETYNQAWNFKDCSQCNWIWQCGAGCPLEHPCEGKEAVCKARRMFFDKLSLFLTKEITFD